MTHIVRGKILRYEEIVNTPAGENGEALVDVRKFDSSIIAEYIKKDMLKFTHGIIYVRETVAKLLAATNKKIANEHPGFLLKIVYGYRHPVVQRRYFDSQRMRLKTERPSLSDRQLDSQTHNFVAVPEAAGHPTGGAIDITIIDETGREIDMGLPIGDFSNEEKMKTFSDRITVQQQENRLYLHDQLVKSGFAPFYGEWWHFSFGDKEWACFYNKPKSIYSTKYFRVS